MSARNQDKGKAAVLAILLLVLFLPAIQAKFSVVRMKPLDGYSTDSASYPTFSWPGVRDNSYQTSFEHYVEVNLGFRPWFIRLRNQLSYTLFRVSHTQEVLVGRDLVLYEKPPIHNYLGEDFVGEAVVEHHIRRFRAVQDTLARRGKLVVLVAVPSKASFMPEYLPAYYQRQVHHQSNYQAYAAAARAAGINFLDLSQAFRQWKDTSAYPLFPRNGIHWSRYGATLAGDTLMRFLEQHYGHDLRDYRLLRGEVRRKAKDTDDDVAKAMNLLRLPKDYPMHYPLVTFQPLKPGQRVPNILLIGDSFTWHIVDPFIGELFDAKQSRFWYYNNEVAWPEVRPEGTKVDALDHKQQYLSRDIILVLVTEYNMNNLDMGFSDKAYTLFTPYTHTDSVRIQQVATRIKNTPNQEEYWWKKSAETGLSFDQLVAKQALAQYDSTRH
jgi:hypothetical protein